MARTLVVTVITVITGVTGVTGVTGIAAGSLPAHAAAWSPAATVSAPDGVASQQQVAIDGSGTATAVWGEERTAEIDVIKTAQREPGGSWSSPQTLSDPARDAKEPQVVASSDGAVVAAWNITEGDGHRIMGAHRPAGGPWGAAATVSAPGGVSRPRLAGNPRGDSVLMWHQRNGLRSSRLAGGAWQTPQPVAAAGLQHEVALNPAGVAYAVWKSADSDDIDRVWAARGSSNGRWGTAETLSRADRHGEHPAVAVDAQGNAQVAWVLRSSRRVVQTAHRPTGGDWSAVTSVSDLSHNAVNPDVALDAEGNALTVWQVNVSTTDISVAAAWRTAAGAWGRPEELAASGASPQAG
ncbi:MAG: hypothetical protein ACRDQB_05220, partial [Thermocrispum sp.]